MHNILLTYVTVNEESGCDQNKMKLLLPY